MSVSQLATGDITSRYTGQYGSCTDKWSPLYASAEAAIEHKYKGLKKYQDSINTGYADLKNSLELYSSSMVL